MTPYYADDWLTVYAGDCRAVLATLPDESVHCVVTSPPYWGLRDYGTASWDGGDADCDHTGVRLPGPDDKSASNRGSSRDPVRHDCRKCGATRVDNQLGLEPTPEQYVANMVAVFREVRRVLRRDGTLWLNLGDSYAGARSEGGGTMAGFNDRYFGRETDGGKQAEVDTSKPARAAVAGLKPKDLVGIPWRVAFALQADGWYLRSDIIWAKPNPMPESVTDRPTKSHEYLFLFAKSERYYFDADAVREEAEYGRRDWSSVEGNLAGVGFDGKRGHATVSGGDPSAGRNIRSVWQIATQPYPGAHFATFPPKLVEPCIKAGTSERGVCAECGAPWRRVVERGNNRAEAMKWSTPKEDVPTDPARARLAQLRNTNGQTYRRWSETTGWQPSCAHIGEPAPATVLDPFAGSGTTGMVAQSLSRRAVLIDLNPAYLMQAMERNADIPLGLVG